MLGLKTFRTMLALATGVGLLIFFLLRGMHSAPVDFDAEIRPILNENCAACHGGVKRESGLSLLSREAVLLPAESGKPALVPGKSRESELIRRVTHPDPKERMPAQGDPLAEEEIEKLERWIEQGAPWPRHWAYVKPEPSDLPTVSLSSWPKNGIDNFVLARMESEGLEPNPPADCRVLARRVSLDLIGLPPAWEEVEVLCADFSDRSWERFVANRLASPHFGEHWAAVWLDLARYADSKGYEKDPYRSIWTYRDWVIEAFNRDMPFDRFTIEQLAGDLLPDPKPRQWIATAFHRNTMTNTEGGTDDEEFRVAAVIDRLNTTMEVWQGTTMRCVQCHSHPFDPFRHEEFYQLLSIFNNTEDADEPDDRPLIATFGEENRDQGQALLAEIEKMEAEIEKRAERPEVEQARRSWKKRLYEALIENPKLLEFEGETISKKILDIARKRPEDRLSGEELELDRFYRAVAPALAQLNGRVKERRKALEKFDPIWTPVTRELPAEQQRLSYVFERGNWRARGKEVAAGVPEILKAQPEDAPGNRLELAQWLVSPENPLTARVTVNRIWSQVFGTGLVETLEDFGTQGDRPSHPQLLDWLALRFIQEHDWSIKALLKELVTSAAYRQSSRISPEKYERDPENRLLARASRFRLSAEQIRDQALAVGGLLSRKQLGPPVMPPQPEGVWNNPYSKQKWETSEGEDAYRRAIYAYWRRTAPYPSLVTFDVPSREICVSRRFRTNTPLQALVTLNDPVYVEAANALARQMEEAASTPRERIARGYELALLRPLDEKRMDALWELYREAAKGRPEPAALAVVAGAILNLDEFLTRE